jgi:hypothetical protein
MVLRRGHREWPDFLTPIIPLYIKHEAAKKLGRGLTQTIERLDTGGYSDAQLDIWNDACQAAGKDCEDLQIPLRGLAAAIEVMKTKTDRSLLRIPLEIRQIIRPLLVKSLPEAANR